MRAVYLIESASHRAGETDSESAALCANHAAQWLADRAGHGDTATQCNGLGDCEDCADAGEGIEMVAAAVRGVAR